MPVWRHWRSATSVMLEWKNYSGIGWKEKVLEEKDPSVLDPDSFMIALLCDLLISIVSLIITLFIREADTGRRWGKVYVDSSSGVCNFLLSMKLVQNKTLEHYRHEELVKKPRIQRARNSGEGRRAEKLAMLYCHILSGRVCWSRVAIEGKNKTAELWHPYRARDTSVNTCLQYIYAYIYTHTATYYT